MAVNYSWNNLPSVVIYDVFTFLEKKDLLNASITCKNWRACLFHPKIWPIKSMTIDLINISAYEFKYRNDAQRSNYRGQVKKPHLNFDHPYSHHHQKNRSLTNQQHNQRFPTYQQRLSERLINKQRSLSNGNQRVDSQTSDSTADCDYSFPLHFDQKEKQHQLLIRNNSNFYAHNTLKADYRQFLEKCSRFLTSVTIKFNPYDHRNLVQLIYTINILTHARTRKSYLETDEDDDSQLDYFNNIESLVLKPIYIKTSEKGNRMNHLSNLRFHSRQSKRNENLNGELLLKVFDAIEKLIATNRSIRQLSLGCLEELLDYLPSLLNKLKNNVHVNQLVESLNLATIKVDPFYYPVHDVKFTWFTSFKNLIKLSIDYDYVTDDFIIQLATNCKKLKYLTLNIHGLDEFHPIVTANAWNHFKQNSNLPDESCEVELTINLLHTNESPEELKEIMQNITIPIVKFSSFFAFSSQAITNDNPLKEILNVISTQQQFNLKQLTLVDELKQRDGILTPNTTFSSMEENILVMLAWRCKNLEELTLIGFELSEIDLLAITRLRGDSLKQLLVPDCCIYLMNSKMLEDEGYYEEDKVFLDYASNSIHNQVISEIAKPLNRSWTPLNSNDLNDTNQYYLNAVLN